MTEHFDLLIRGATVVDGTGAPGYAADVGVRGDRIAHIGPLAQARADVEIDASGKVAAPGFIDAHTHDDRLLLSGPEMTPKVSQGVTTVVSGNCGISLAPAPTGMRAPVTPPLDLLDGEGGWFHFPTFGAYVEELRAHPAAINCAPLVGHTTLRVVTLDDVNRPATGAEIAHMRGLVQEALAAGAIGVSTGLYYEPAAAAPTEEVIEICRPLREFGGLYVTHMRSEGERIMDSLDGKLSDRPRGRGAGRDLASQGRRYRQSRPFHGDAGVHRATHAQSTHRARLLPLFRLLDHFVRGTGGRRVARARHVVEAPSRA